MPNVLKPLHHLTKKKKWLGKKHSLTHTNYFFYLWPTHQQLGLMLQGLKHLLILEHREEQNLYNRMTTDPLPISHNSASHQGPRCCSALTCICAPLQALQVLSWKCCTVQAHLVSHLQQNAAACLLDNNQRWCWFSNITHCCRRVVLKISYSIGSKWQCGVTWFKPQSSTFFQTLIWLPGLKMSKL